MPRLIGVDIPPNKRLEIALTYVYGVGDSTARKACDALGLDRDRLEREPQLAGPLLENFALMEIRKQASWSDVRPGLFHYRTQTGQEIDLLLEDAAGRVVAIEVKAGTAVGERDVRPMLDLAEQLGQRFVRGLVLHTGSTEVPWSDRVAALPLSVLWQAG